MSEHGPERHVTNTPDALHASVELIIDDNPTLRVNFNSDLLKTKSVDIRSAANCDEDNICFQLYIIILKWVYVRIGTSAYCILLAVFRSFCLDEDFAILLFSGDDLGVELEFEPLLRQRFLELFPEQPQHSVPIQLSATKHRLLTKSPRRCQRLQCFPRTQRQ